MGEKVRLKKGAWSSEEDEQLSTFRNTPAGRLCPWSKVPIYADLNRDGKSCRLRWMNYLRPGLKRGPLTRKEKELILEYHEKFGPRWSEIAKFLPGRSDNAIKNCWNTHLKEKTSKTTIPKKATSVRKPSKPAYIPIPFLILESSGPSSMPQEEEALVWPEPEEMEAFLKVYNEIVIPSKPCSECESNADITSVLDFPESPQNYGFPPWH